MEVVQPARALLAVAVLSALASLASAPATAQEVRGDAPAMAQEVRGDAPEQRATTLSGITVTAQKREEALQDVPIVINVLDEQLLQDAGLHDIKDMQVLVPGLSVTST